MIALNELRATLTAWHDRVIAMLMLLVALAFIRGWFADRSWTVATLAALAAGGVIGIGSGRLVASRLAFHASDGLLSAAALLPQTRRRYLAAWHGVGLALLAAVTVIARPSMLVVSGPAYLVGVLVAGSAGSVRVPGRIAVPRRAGWALRGWLHRPIAGVAAATILLASLAPARALGTNALMPVIGIETMFLALLLTGVDDTIVRFMTIAGYASWRTIVRHAKGIAAFAAVSMPGCWIILGPIEAGIVAAACTTMLLLLILRILAYRLHAKRFADVLVALLAGLLMLVTYAMPAALPVIALAMVWQLHRRARAKAWLLA